MKRLVLAIVFLAAACSPSMFSGGVPGATVGPTPSPSATLLVETSPTAQPTPSVLALGEAYLVVADKYSHARARLENPYTVGWKLLDYRRSCASSAQVTTEFVTGMGKIPFTTAAMKKDAAALVKESKLEIKAFKRCAAAKTMTIVRQSTAQVKALAPSGTAASQKLRHDLGLATH